MTTIAAPVANTDCPVEGPQIRVDLDGHDHITARINRWPSEDRDHGMPPFPAVDEVQLDLLTGCGVVQMDATQTRAVAAGLHRFADELAGLADQLDAMAQPVTAREAGFLQLAGEAMAAGATMDDFESIAAAIKDPDRLSRLHRMLAAETRSVMRAGLQGAIDAIGGAL